MPRRWPRCGDRAPCHRPEDAASTWCACCGSPPARPRSKPPRCAARRCSKACGAVSTPPARCSSRPHDSRELGLRHGLLETELYAGIVELFADEPVAAEPHLREAFAGLGRLGIGADAGQAAAYLARALLQQDGSTRPKSRQRGDAAGQNLQTAIAARSVLAEVLAARGEFRRSAAPRRQAVRIAAGTDITLDHANALASLARVRLASGDTAGVRRAAESARELYEAKGAVVALDLADADDLDTAVGGAGDAATGTDTSPTETSLDRPMY